jgi:hypothetical protein
MKCHYSHTRKVKMKMKRTDTIQCWQEISTITTHTLLVRLYNSTVTLENYLTVSNETDINLLYDPEIPLLSICPKETVFLSIKRHFGSTI